MPRQAFSVVFGEFKLLNLSNHFYLKTPALICFGYQLSAVDLLAYLLRIADLVKVYIIQIDLVPLKT
jgi:hypothetical protein